MQFDASWIKYIVWFIASLTGTQINVPRSDFDFMFDIMSKSFKSKMNQPEADLTSEISRITSLLASSVSPHFSASCWTRIQVWSASDGKDMDAEMDHQPAWLEAWSKASVSAFHLSLRSQIQVVVLKYLKCKLTIAQLFLLHSHAMLLLLLVPLLLLFGSTASSCLLQIKNTCVISYVPWPVFSLCDVAICIFQVLKSSIRRYRQHVVLHMFLPVPTCFWPVSDPNGESSCWAYWYYKQWSQ